MSLVIQRPLQTINNGWEMASHAIRSRLSKKIINFLQRHADADVLIVTGAAGEGKTSFIKSITGADLYVSSTLESGTRQTALVPAVIGGKRFLFLDMPGFNTADTDDLEIFRMLMHALTTIQSYVRFRGVLYFDSIKDIRLTPAAQKILTWLFHFCGPQFMPNVTIVTTKWAGLDADGIHDKRARFETWKGSDLFTRFLSSGAKEYHHGLVQESGSFRTLHPERMAGERRVRAMEMITTNYHAPTPLTLKIYDEIADGTTIEATSAGRCLRSPSTFNPLPDETAAVDEQDNARLYDTENILIGSAETTGSSHSHSTGDEENTTNSTGGYERYFPGPETTGAPGDQGRQSGGSWTEFFFEDVQPWLRLLFRAAQVYYRHTSAGSPPSDILEDYRFEDHYRFPSFEYDTPTFTEVPWTIDESEEGFFGEEDTSSGWWCMMM